MFSLLGLDDGWVLVVSSGFAGAVVSTCFTNNVGRVVDFCEGVVREDEVWLLSSPHRWQSVLQTMDKFIFPMDK